MDLSAINWVDAILGGVVIISVLIGIVRGLVRELLSAISWGLSIWLAYRFAGMVAEAYVMQIVSDRSISYMLAFGGIFLVSLFCLGLLGLVLAQLFARSGLGGVDMLFGMIFGFLRGVLFSALIVFCVRYTSFTEEESWKNSTLQPFFSRFVQWGVQELNPKISAFLLQEDENKSVQNPNPTATSVQKSSSEALPPQKPVLKLESVSE